MRLVPDDHFGRISFYRTRIAYWIERAEELGITVESAELLQAEVEAAWEAYQAALRARAAARAATHTMYNAVDKMGTSGSALLSQIKGHAAMTNDDNVYTRAYISAPATPSPVGEPGMPGDFKVELTPLGSVKLSWKCRTPRGAGGTVYKISRRIMPDGAIEFLDVVGEKKFEDTTLPTGTSELRYYVQPIRSRKAGLIGECNVTFGVSENTPREMFGMLSKAA